MAKIEYRNRQVNTFGVTIYFAADGTYIIFICY